MNYAGSVCKCQKSDIINLFNKTSYQQSCLLKTASLNVKMVQQQLVKCIKCDRKILSCTQKRKQNAIPVS